MTDKQTVAIMAAILWAGNPENNMFNITSKGFITRDAEYYLDGALSMFHYIKYSDYFDECVEENEQDCKEKANC